jgi:sulfate adenylyltransferase
LQKTALEVVDGLLVHPLIGRKKVGDFRNEVIVGAYDVLIKNYYPSNSMLFGVLTTMMHYAGPMEAVHHAIMRRNHGCTHFIVGRDHAGVGDYYSTFAAQKVFDEFPDLGIEPLRFDNAFYCKRCGSICTAKTCPHSNDSHLVFSGTRIRKLLLNGSGVPFEMIRPEVYDYLKKIPDLYVN